MRRRGRTRISAKNQATIPVAALRRAGLKPGDELRVEAAGAGRIILTRVEETLAGYTGALLTLGVVALAVVATNPFALVFVLPSLHAWLWLPQLRGRALALRTGVLLLGFAGPALLVWSFAVRFGLGLDAPWYIAWLFSLDRERGFRALGQHPLMTPFPENAQDPVGRNGVAIGCHEQLGGGRQ